MYKQIIILRKDLGMSLGKTCAQVSHGSMAFLTSMIRNAALPYRDEHSLALLEKPIFYKSFLHIDKDLYEQWINDSFTKCVLEAKNKNQLLKAKTMAEELGMKEGIDFFLIKDSCRTELEPEEVDENGIGRTLTCIGFRPFPSEIIDKIGKKYQLYK